MFSTFVSVRLEKTKNQSVFIAAKEGQGRESDAECHSVLSGGTIGKFSEWWNLLTKQRWEFEPLSLSCLLSEWARIWGFLPL